MLVWGRMVSCRRLPTGRRLPRRATVNHVFSDDPNQDRVLRRLVELQDRFNNQLQSASPGCSREVSADTAVTMAALWEVSILHQRYVERLLKMEFPHDTDALRMWTIEVEVNWLSQARGFMRDLDKLLDECRRSLEAQRRAQAKAARGMNKKAPKRGRPKP